MKKGLSLVTHIIVLLAIIAGAIGAFVYFNGSALYQFCVVVAAVVINAVWGVFYHYSNKRLTAGLIWEYVLIGALVLLLFSWTIFS